MWRGPIDLEFALDCWANHNESQFVPPLLLPFAYASHCFLFVELESDYGPGGSVWSGEYAGCDFVREFDDLSACIMAWTLTDPNETEIEDSWSQRVAQQWAVAPSHPTYGRQRTFGDLPESWPLNWKSSAGYRAEAERPKGRTRSLNSTRHDGRARSKRQSSRVNRIVGSSPGSWNLVSDEAAQAAAYEGLSQFFGGRAPSATAVALRYLQD